MESTAELQCCEHSKEFKLTDLDFTKAVECGCEDPCDDPRLLCLHCEAPQLVCSMQHIITHKTAEYPLYTSHSLYFDFSISEVWCSKCMSNVAVQGEFNTVKQKFTEWQMTSKLSSLSIKEKLSYEQVVKGLKEKSYKQVVILTGAGISVSAGIPDFRSPGSGIYANLQKYNLKRPEDLFTLSFFLQKPEVFYAFSKEFDLEKYLPTPTHFFIRLLQDEGLLAMNLTQNIDNLEEKAGIYQDKLVQAHGSIKGAACGKCKKKMDPEVFKEHVKEGKIYKCSSCLEAVKPQIVFFGESLPRSFFDGMDVVSSCDLLIIMGTALAVSPFNQLPSMAPSTAHQVLINRENLAEYGFDFEKGANRLFLKGNCDDVIEKLVRDLGLEEKFQSLLPKKAKDEESKL